MKSRILGNLLRIGRCFRLYRRRALGDTELHPAQQLLLSQICRCPGLTQEELSEALFLDKTTVARQLLKLEEQGYVRRSPSPEDGRCRRIGPTEQGEAVYPRIRKAFEDFTEGILAGLSPEERACLEKLSERLLENARGLLPGGPGGEET